MDPLNPMLMPSRGMDPFSLGMLLRQNPEALVGELAKNGPPPAEGQGFMDWVASKMQGAMQGPVPGANPIDSPLAVGPVPGQAPPMPGMPGVGALTGGPWSGVDTVPGVGPVPGGPIPAMPTPQPNLAGVTADEAQRRSMMPPAESPRPVGAPMDITSDAQKGQDLASRMSGAGDALKKAASPFAGLRAPPAPQTQRISSPGLPRPGAMPQGGVAALVQALLSGQQSPAPGLRLGNALYAGGRGLY